jgi:hypothetical protein
MVLVAGVVVVYVVTRPDDAAAGEIFLEGNSSTGTDPFGNLPGPAIAVTTSSTATSTPTTPAASTAVRTVSGGQRGLYGGTLNGGRCDPEGQIAYLTANPALAGAFVSALNRDPTLRWTAGTQVSVAQLPSYIRELTSVTLVSDTRITNYGYRNGRPTPRQAVLQAGTAVMVDRYGVPRIKCNCGNPLTQPQAVARLQPRHRRGGQPDHRGHRRVRPGEPRWWRCDRTWPRRHRDRHRPDHDHHRAAGHHDHHRAAGHQPAAHRRAAERQLRHGRRAGDVDLDG